MIDYPDETSQRICDYVDKMVPITADAEINYALKKYYLGAEYNEEEVNRIIRKREDDLKKMMDQLQLTSFEELEAPVEETKSMDMVREDAETSADTIIQGHENDKLIDGENSVDITERGYEI